MHQLGQRSVRIQWMVERNNENPSGFRKRFRLSRNHIWRLKDRQVDENQTSGKICLGLSVVVRVTLRDGTYHEVQDSESGHLLDYADQTQGCGLRTH